MQTLPNADPLPWMQTPPSLGCRLLWDADPPPPGCRTTPLDADPRDADPLRTEWHTSVKTLPYPKLRLRAVNIRNLPHAFRLPALFGFFFQRCLGLFGRPYSGLASFVLCFFCFFSEKLYTCIVASLALRQLTLIWCIYETLFYNVICDFRTFISGGIYE